MRRSAVLLPALLLAASAAPARAQLSPPWLGAWGAYGYETGAFRHCGAVAVDGDGDVFVADEDNERVQKFTARGAFLLAIGPGLPDTLAFSRPAGLACSRDGKLYVADWGNNRVEVFSTATGEFVQQWGTYGSGPGEFDRPSAIGVDYTGRIYVGDLGVGRIQVFLADGSYYGTILLPPYQGTAAEARAMCITPGGRIYITDGNGQRVIEYLTTGAIVVVWGHYGMGLGELWGVNGVATDLSGNVYVAEEVNERVQVFTGNGTALGFIGGPGSGDGQFGAASGIAFDPVGDMFVTDSGNDRVEKFGSSGITPARHTTWGRIKAMYR